MSSPRGGTVSGCGFADMAISGTHAVLKRMHRLSQARSALMSESISLVFNLADFYASHPSPEQAPIADARNCRFRAVTEIIFSGSRTERLTKKQVRMALPF